MLMVICGGVEDAMVRAYPLLKLHPALISEDASEVRPTLG
jgi:hypothetical protein